MGKDFTLQLAFEVVVGEQIILTCCADAFSRTVWDPFKIKWLLGILAQACDPSTL